VECGALLEIPYIQRSINISVSALPKVYRSVSMSTVTVTATIEIEFEVTQELAQLALTRIPYDVAVGIEHGSIGSSMTGVVPGTAKVHVTDKVIDGKPVA